MKHISFVNPVWGYVAGIVTGVTYGLNPLFAVPLMKRGLTVDEILFFRYFLAVVLLCIWMSLRREAFRITFRQFRRLLLLGLLFSASSLCLFESYNFIPSGIATTIVFLYPVLVAIIMVFLKVYPKWQVWLSIALTFVGVLLLCRSDSGQVMQWKGLLWAFSSALAYSLFIVIINRSTAIRSIPNNLLTFYALLVGTAVFSVHAGFNHVTGNLSGVSGSFLETMTAGLGDSGVWANLFGLAFLPTVVSTATLALATRLIGATKASVLGVFEPVTAIMVGVLAFNERITFSVVAGIAIISVAIVFMIVSSAKESR